MPQICKVKSRWARQGKRGRYLNDWSRWTGLRGFLCGLLGKREGERVRAREILNIIPSGQIVETGLRTAQPVGLQMFLHETGITGTTSFRHVGLASRGGVELLPSKYPPDAF